MAKILLPDDAIRSLENIVIEPYKDIHPMLGIVIAKNPDPGDKAYYNQIAKCAEKYEAKLVTEQPASLVEAYQAVEKLSNKIGVDGIIILSSFQDENDQFLKDYIPYALDIDCASSSSLGHMICDKSFVFYRNAPCTAAAVYKIIEYYGIELEGKRVGVVGRSLKVGRPVAEILVKRDATVTLYHSKSDLSDLCNCDIVVSAIGKPKFLTENYFHEGQVVIDVGINTDPETGKICGDVDFENVREKIGESGMITPVPGCIGPMTNAVLFAKLFVNAIKMRGMSFSIGANS